VRNDPSAKINFHAVRTPAEEVLLGVAVAQTAKRGHRSRYELRVEEARKHGLPGAIAIRGIRGYDSAGEIHLPQ
jgi:PII-like signaling protein